jgi:hypothetical protein
MVWLWFGLVIAFLYGYRLVRIPNKTKAKPFGALEPVTLEVILATFFFLGQLNPKRPTNRAIPSPMIYRSDHGSLVIGGRVRRQMSHCSSWDWALDSRRRQMLKMPKGMN